MNSNWQRTLRVPLHFMQFAFVEGKLFYMPQKKSTFVITDLPKWGNDVVYGGIFALKDYHFYIRSLDAYMGCTKSTLGRNHQYDMQHRINVSATTISFDTIEEFTRLLYKEVNTVNCEMYVGNDSHPKLQDRLTHRHRITDGLDKHNFKHLLREEKENGTIL